MGCIRFLLFAAIVVKVITLLTNIAKRRAAEAMEFEHELFTFLVAREVNIRLLAGTNFLAQGGDDTPRFQVAQRQNIVTRIRQAIAVATAATSFVRQQLVAQQRTNNLVRTACGTPRQIIIRDAVKEWQRNDAVVLHARFDRFQDTKIRRIHRAHHGCVQFHRCWCIVSGK